MAHNGPIVQNPNAESPLMNDSVSVCCHGGGGGSVDHDGTEETIKTA